MALVLEEPSVAMIEFLTSVDKPARSEDFIKKVANILAGAGLELTEPLDLDGVSMDVISNALPGSVSTKSNSFIWRAIRKATVKGNLMANTPVTPGGLFPAARPTPDEFGTLGTAATQEQNYDMAEFFAKKKLAAKKVHVMLAPLLRKINVNDLSESAWPQGFAMNAAATEASRRSSLLVDAGSTVVVQVQRSPGRGG